MTDRELLELAAKAAGVERGADRLDSGVSLTEGGRHRSLPKWNPLADDGDALRLSSTLRLSISHDECECCVWAAPDYDGICDADHATIERVHTVGRWPQELQSRDAATRRAIVRCAAAIALAMNGTAGAKQQDQQGSAD